MVSKVGRNKPCPCGSGKKYKNCCGRSGISLYWTKLNKVLLAILLVVAVGAVVSVQLTKNDQPASSGLGDRAAKPLSSQSDQSPSNQASGELTPQPKGPIPEGKYWSASSGEWRDVPEFTSQTKAGDGASPDPAKYTPQPPGPAPEGKVWSPEHGHWHNQATNLTPLSTDPASQPPGQAPLIQPQPTGPTGELTPQPAGDAPEGKVWSPEHGHWHNASDTGAYMSTQPAPQPPGPAPPGKFWSPEHGHWHSLPAEYPWEKVPLGGQQGPVKPADTASKPPVKVVPLPKSPE